MFIANNVWWPVYYIPCELLLGQWTGGQVMQAIEGGYLSKSAGLQGPGRQDDVHVSRARRTTVMNHDLLHCSMNTYVNIKKEKPDFWATSSHTHRVTVRTQLRLKKIRQATRAHIYIHPPTPPLPRRLHKPDKGTRSSHQIWLASHRRRHRYYTA